MVPEMVGLRRRLGMLPDKQVAAVQNDAGIDDNARGIRPPAPHPHQRRRDRAAQQFGGAAIGADDGHLLAAFRDPHPAVVAQQQRELVVLVGAGRKAAVDAGFDVDVHQREGGAAVFMQLVHELIARRAPVLVVQLGGKAIDLPSRQDADGVVGAEDTRVVDRRPEPGAGKRHRRAAHHMRAAAAGTAQRTFLDQQADRQACGDGRHAIFRGQCLDGRDPITRKPFALRDARAQRRRDARIERHAARSLRFCRHGLHAGHRPHGIHPPA